MANHILSTTAQTAREIDVSMFDDLDVANIVLQRSEVGDVGNEIRAWMDGDDAPLLAFARANRDQILADAYRIAERECGVFTPATDKIAPKRIVDIGCGYAFADLVLFRRYLCDIVLIDIEEGNSRHFGFQGEGAGYTSLDKARSFLVNNDVPDERITTLNPKTGDVSALGTFDLAFSLASCGFHYPVSTYQDLFNTQINEGGGIVLDIRKGSGGIEAMKAFGETEVLAKHPKYATVIARKGSV